MRFESSGVSPARFATAAVQWQSASMLRSSGPPSRSSKLAGLVGTRVPPAVPCPATLGTLRPPLHRRVFANRYRPPCSPGQGICTTRYQLAARKCGLFLDSGRRDIDGHTQEVYIVFGLRSHRRGILWKTDLRRGPVRGEHPSWSLPSPHRLQRQETIHHAMPVALNLWKQGCAALAADSPMSGTPPASNSSSVRTAWLSPATL